MKSFKKNSGFTLIEIIVVIGIMAVLTIIIYASFSGAKTQSRDQKRVTDINSIQLALETYFTQYHSYPPTLDSLTPKYIYEIPTPPVGGANSTYNYIPIGNTVCYSYHLWTKLETNTDSLSSKRGFNSITVSTSCAGSQSYASSTVDAASDPLIYDVTP